MYSIESAKKKGLSIVPLNISVDSQTYRDFEDITSTQLLTMIEEHKIPKTSQPSLGEKIDLYNKLSKDGDGFWFKWNVPDGYDGKGFL